MAVAAWARHACGGALHGVIVALRVVRRAVDLAVALCGCGRPSCETFVHVAMNNSVLSDLIIRTCFGVALDVGLRRFAMCVGGHYAAPIRSSI